MRLALFGATGQCGAPLLTAAIDAGHHVHALARTPDKIRHQHARLTVTEGDALDPAAVAATVAGADAVISTLGGFRGPASLSAGTHNILVAMHQHAVDRLVLVQGLHLRFPGDRPGINQRLTAAVMRVAGGDILRHSSAMADTLRADDLRWTLVRVPRVVPGPATGTSRFGQLQLWPWSHVTTGDISTALLDLAASSGSVHQAPMLASGKPGRPSPQHPATN